MIYDYRDIPEWYPDRMEIEEIPPHSDVNGGYPAIDEPLGHRFGMLTVVALIYSRKFKSMAVGTLMKCDCGKHRKVSVNAIRLRKVPLACEYCEITDPRLINMNIVSRKGIYTDRMKMREYSKFIRDNKPLYNVWEERKKHMVKRWRESFVQFVCDMQPRPEGKFLCRKNVKLFHSPRNSYWGERGEDFLKVEFKLDGRTVTTETLNKEYGIRPSFTRKWRAKGLTPEQIIEKWKTDGSV